MKTTKNPSKYDAYSQGEQESLTTARAAIAFLGIAKIFDPNVRGIIAVAPAALPDVAIEEMIAEGISMDRAYQFELVGSTGQKRGIGTAFQSFRSGTNDVLALQQIFELPEEQVLTRLLAADQAAKLALMAYIKGIIDTAIAFDGGR